MENHLEDEKSQLSLTQTRYSNNTNKKFSILPDLATGWRPKALAIPPPILVKYKENYIQYLINNQPKFNYNVIYLGPRHYNSFSFHNQVLHEYHVRFGLKNQQLPQHFQHQIEKYKSLDNRQFVGMNPKLKNKSHIQFDSNFQSGNLDLVIQRQQNQFDLFLRPDTNTCGHTQWFYFKINVKNNSTHKQYKKIKMNICNNKKIKTLYCKGMKPYVLSKKIQQKQNIGWHQQGENVIYKKYKNPYACQSININQPSQKQQSNQNQKSQEQVVQQTNQNGQNIKFKEEQNYYCLSFQYQLQYDQDEIYFAYCPPYTYSQLRKQISNIKKRVNTQQHCILTQQKLCISLSGVEVPLLTVTDPSIQDQHKKFILSTGRIHPGQSNGSYVIEGFINFLVSPQAQNLRKNCVFKIVPMLNPDGVILGNFRTGLAGKDLNRQFKVKNLLLLPEIASLKQYIRKLKFQKGSNLLYYLDFHGHSTKKNVFVYGPQYDIWDLKFQRSKILPKLVSCKTNMFKLNSCIFKVANYKKATSRAFMLGHIPFCYTVQSSIGIYKQKNGQNFDFTIQKWKQMGQNIGEVFDKCLQKLKQQTFNLMRKDKKKKKSIFLKNANTQLGVQSQPLNNQNSSVLGLLQNSLNLIKTQSPSKQATIDSNRTMFKSLSLQSIQHSKTLLEPIRNIRKHQKQVNLIFPKIKQQKNQSDQQDQGDGKSDCESQSNDFTKNQYQLLSKDIMKVIQDFKIVVENQNNVKRNSCFDKKNYSIDKKKQKKKSSQTANTKSILLKGIDKNKIHKKDVIEMRMVPSLKHKLININNLNFGNQKINEPYNSNNRQKNPFNHFQKNSLNNFSQKNVQRGKNTFSQPKLVKSGSFNIKNHHPSLMIVKAT